ncbi:MAG: ABC transporter permease [Thermodesulfobacteriota bacterium]|jgi:ABC-type dipeptide/oligopeptide/nickel transport system permease subunit|nr:MAG: ABC transporter permease [Thermodesulfobacteriota bacterium]
MRKPLWSYLKKNKLAFIALTVVIFMSLGAMIGPMMYPISSTSIDLASIKLPPSLMHPCGTDSKGRDILSRILWGARVSLSISLSAALGSILIGLFLGLIAGYCGGKFDTFITMIIDLTLAFPSLLLAIGITVVLPPGFYTVIIALALVGWASFARLIRGLTIAQKESLFVEASRSIGCSTQRIILRHILPNSFSPILIAFSLKIGSFILAESALSFLGLGVQPPIPTWGSMISLNRIYINSAPWMIIFPGLAIAMTTFSFNIIGDFLRDYLDPHLNF